MRVKQLTNDPAHIVAESMDGFALFHNGVAKLGEWNVIVREDIETVRASKVAVISGGGSGHEPSHSGWVGKGMLSAAVVGNVFASPSTQSVLAAILACTGEKGCLVIIKNYTGDRINFGLAVEQAKARGLNVEMLVVGDDCAIGGRGGEGGVGRRGLAGTVFVHKVAGSASEQGLNLNEVHRIASAAANGVGTIGVALTVCNLPGKDQDTRLGEHECEIGLGIHGEQGAVTTTLPRSDELVDETLKRLFSTEEGFGYCTPEKNSDVAVLVNNLGGTTNLEMGVVCRQAIQTLTTKYNLFPARVLSGALMTSLDMRGFSISILQLTPEISQHLDFPTTAPSWASNAIRTFSRPTQESSVSVSVPVVAVAGGSGSEIGEGVLSGLHGGRNVLTEEQAARFKASVVAACQAVLEIQNHLTELDTQVGDGDCGDTLAMGARSILERVEKMNFLNPASAFASIAEAVECMGGTSGAIYTILFTSIATSLHNSINSAKNEDSILSRDLWAGVCDEGIATVSKYGRAQRGHRTMMDALFPALEALKAGKDLNEVAASAKQGADNTIHMHALSGRSSYVPVEVLSRVCDPGAVCVAHWIAAAAKQL